MAEGNQLTGALGAHRAGDDRGLEHGALGGLDIATGKGSTDDRRQNHAGPRMCSAAGHGLAADIHHGGLILVIHMGQHAATQLNRKR